MKVTRRLLEACNASGSLLTNAEDKQGHFRVALYGKSPESQALLNFCAKFSGVQVDSFGVYLPFACVTLPKSLFSQWLLDPLASQAVAGADLNEDYASVEEATLQAQEPENLKEKDHLQHVVFQKWRGKKVKVALLDTGMTRNQYIPEKNVKHFDLVDGGGEASPRHDHATMISHLLVGRNQQVPGLIPLCDLFDIRIFSSSGFSTVGTILRGLELAVAQEADILNCSWGSQVPSEPINYALQAMVQAGILVVCSAGNNGSANGEPGSSTIGWPARNPFVVAVGSVNGQGQLSSFSSTGDRENQTKPNLVELGEGILTAGTTREGPYGAGMVATLVRGTSFSCPRVVAVASQLVEAAQSKRLAWTPESITNQLQKLCSNPTEKNAGKK